MKLEVIPSDLGVIKMECISAPIPPTKFFAVSSVNDSPIVGERRSLRRQVVDSFASETASSKKRVRRLSADNQDVGAIKKVKVEEKKALTIVVNTRKVEVEAARRRWLRRHRHIFEPLLPVKSGFFNNLEKEMKTDTKSYIPLHKLDEQPSIVQGGQMKDYQLQGLSYMIYMHNNGMNCILGDEMGLGKTLQALSLLAYVKEHSTGISDPDLVICPLSVLSSWLSEASRWVPSLRTIRFHGLQHDRDRIKNGARVGMIHFDVCFTTYETFVAEEHWFKSRRWNYCVLDEGHRIKNADTAMSQKLQGVGALHRLILTGTPVQNDLTELWSLIHWLYPFLFVPSTQRLFQASFDLSQGSYSLPFLKAAQSLLDTIMLRRTKAQVEMSVPPRDESIIFIPLTEAQRFWTYRLLTRMDTLDLKQIFTVKLEPDDDINEGRRQVQEQVEAQISCANSRQQSAWKRLMNLLMQLRKVCDHPYLLPNAEPSPFVIGEHIVASSSKMIVIDKILADVLPKGEKVLIFSQWTGMLDLMEDFMTLRSISYARLDGQTTRPRRALDIRLFQQENSPYQVFLISTKAGGLGINLSKASTVIMVDSDWNPQIDLQAIARAHRIGQTKIVKVYRLICKGSVEDQMLDRIRRKLFLSLKVMGSSGDNSSSDSNSGLGMNELMDILRKGSSALSRDDDYLDLSRFLSASIEEIVEASRKQEERQKVKVKRELGDEDIVKEEEKEEVMHDIEEEEMRLLSGIVMVRSRLFEGRIVGEEQKKNKNKDIAREWEEMQNRAPVGKTVAIDGIKVTANHVAPLAGSSAPKLPTQRRRGKFESEDWCIYCRDGGELILCNQCPRVFHASCHGISEDEMRKPQLMCSQHACHQCHRNTGDAGGMLFRCQTCPQAFCEDCLPEDDLHIIGETLPEFIVLGYEVNRGAYFIRCDDCKTLFAENPEVLQSWEEETRETAEKLRVLMESE